MAALPAVAAIENATFVFGGVIPESSEEPVEAFLFAGNVRAFGARVIDGRQADPAAGAEEFVATTAWVDATGAALGDRVQVITISQEQADALGFDVADPAGPTLTATLVGLIAGPSELEDETPLALFDVALLDLGDVGVASSVGAIELRAGSTVDDLRAQLDTLSDGDVFGLDTAEWVPEEVRTAVRAQGQGLAVVALIVGIAAVAVVGQLTSRQVRIPETQRLALRAVGLTRRQFVAEPVLSVALPIVVGSAVAGVLAYGLSGSFPIGFVDRVEPAQGLLFDPSVHVVGALLLAVVLVGWVTVSLILAERQTRLTRRRGAAELFAGRLPPSPVSTGFRYALVRHPRDPGSARAPIVGLVLVESVLIGALVFAASVDRFLDEPARFGSNFDFATGAGGDAVPQDLLDVLQTDPDVTDVTLFGTLIASVGPQGLDVTGMQQLRGDLEPDVLVGRLAETPEEVVLGRVAARDLSLGVDDRLEVAGAEGIVSFVVTGLAVIPSIEGGDGIGEGALVTLEGLRRLEPGAALGSAAVRVRTGADAAVERIGAAFDSTVGLPDRPAAVVNVDRVRTTPFIVAYALAALALLSMSQQLISSARRRRRDLAMVRALGAKRGWVSNVLHWQVSILALAVAIVAVPLGIVLGRFVYGEYIDRIGARTDVLVPWGWLALVLVGALVVGNLAAVVAAWRPRHEQPAVTLADR